MAYTGTTKSDVVQSSWQVIMDPYFSAQLRNNKQYNRFGMAKMYKSKGTSGVIKFKKYARLSVATTALTEGTTPSNGTKSESSTVELTPLEYGDFIEIDNLVTEDSESDEVKEALDNLSDQASATLNIITRDALLTTTNIYYANSVATVGAIVTAITEDDILGIMSTLEGADVNYVTDYVGGSPNDNTTPIEPSFICITHPHSSTDIRKLTNYIPPVQYGRDGRLFGEIGSVYNVRFVGESANQITINAGGDVGSTGLRSTGSSKVDVYDSVIIGKDAYVRVKLNKDTVQTFVNGFGSSGVADPLHQRMSVGWRVRHGAKWMYAEKVIRYRHGASA